MAKIKYMTLEDIVAILTSGILENTETLIEKCDTYKITNYYDILERLQKIKSREPGFLKLISQAQQALSEKTAEAKEFMQSLDLFVTAFDIYGKEQGINRNWKKLLNTLHDKKLQYQALKTFQDKMLGFDYFEDTILVKECANNPYATANDILWCCLSTRESFESPMFKRGLEKFDKEFNDEARKDKPDFNKWAHIFNLIYEYYIDEEGPVYISRESDEFIDFVANYSSPAISRRIILAQYKKEYLQLLNENQKLKEKNKKLNAQLRAKKTTGLKKGIANVASKAKATKSNSKQR